MSRIPRVCAACLVGVLLLGATPAASKVRVIPGSVVLPVRLAPGFAPSSSTTVLHLTITEAGCGPRYSRAILKWTPHRLSVTLLAKPYQRQGVAACPEYIAILPLKVPLGRPLGERAIYDGGYVPARLVHQAPLD